MLRKQRPNAFIALAVGESCQDVARHLSFFDEIHAVDDRALMASGAMERFREAIRFLKFLQGDLNPRRAPYSEVFIFHRDWRYALLTGFAGIPLRRGFDSSLGRIFLTHPYRAGGEEHHIHQYLGMAGRSLPEKSAAEDPLAGLWSFHSGEKENALAHAELHGFRRESRNWIALGFGGGRNVKTRTHLKTWPIGQYHALATRLIERGYPVVWLGDQEDACLLADLPVGLNLSGKLSVVETAAVLSLCERAISNDTLILHLAQAMGVPAIGLFGPTDPRHYRPLAARSGYLWMGDKLSCSPCHKDGYFPPCHFQHACMTNLSVESVLQKLEELK